METPNAAVNHHRTVPYRIRIGCRWAKYQVPSYSTIRRGKSTSKWSRKKRKAITPIISGARLVAQCSAVSIHIWRLLLLLISCNDVCSCISGRGGANTAESVTRVHNNCICVRLRRAYLVVGAAASTKATRDDSRPCLCLSALNSYWLPKQQQRSSSSTSFSFHFFVCTQMKKEGRK